MKTSWDVALTAMMGKNIGFNTQLKAVAPHCRIIHCFIHRQALAAKKLSIELYDVMNVCVKVVNLLKAKALNSRLFSELCSDEKHKTLLLHTEVRWLSRGRVLGRLFELCDKVREFLRDTESEYITYFESHEFMLRLAYLSDIFYHFNQANLKLQGPETTVIDCKQVMNAFCKRLKLWCDKLQHGNTEMFPGLSEILEETIIFFGKRICGAYDECRVRNYYALHGNTGG